MNPPPIERALLSVSDKRGLTDFARRLTELNIQLYASGGTRRHLVDAGIPVVEIAQYTGFPEMMDGRIKTLHPKIHGGILCRRDRADDLRALETQGIVPFELVVVNLYPFSETIARRGVTRDEAIEQIDIGGPTLVRGAAKNHAFVTIASSPDQYPAILDQIAATGTTTLELRRELATAAFAHTARYDQAIAQYLAREQADDAEPTNMPTALEIVASRKASLRYGENPHQSAALYVSADAARHALVHAEQLHGKELSYNNLLDLDAALALARSLPRPGVAVLKHNNPCGAATGESLGAAIEKAWEGDPTSAFGSILGFNVPVDRAAAEFLAEPGKFVEAIVAPDFEAEALEILTTRPKWKANVRLLKAGEVEPGQGAVAVRSIDGGYLVQSADDLADDPAGWQVVTAAQPDDARRADLAFAWTVVRHVKSNAIVLVRDAMVVGVGAGQMSRVDAVEMAIRKAGDRANGAVLASDAFFPFDDSVHQAAGAGLTAIVQPGGSRRDAEVIAACDEHQLSMIFTGRRHFRH